MQFYYFCHRRCAGLRRSSPTCSAGVRRLAPHAVGQRRILGICTSGLDRTGFRLPLSSTTMRPHSVASEDDSPTASLTLAQNHYATRFGLIRAFNQRIFQLIIETMSTRRASTTTLACVFHLPYSHSVNVAATASPPHGVLPVASAGHATINSWCTRASDPWNLARQNRCRNQRLPASPLAPQLRR